MAVLSALSRRRKIILLCAALGISGYASYKVYRSSFVCRKRRRLASFLSSLSRLFEAFSLGVDSTSVLAGDLRTFLFSDTDDVPSSLKQSLKIVRCKEFQDALTVFSSCISRGVVRSVVDPSSGIDETGGLARRRNGEKGVNIFIENREQAIRSRDANEKHVLCTNDACGSSGDSLTSRRQYDLPERLMQKLFSESGKGFASAVLGSVARNAILSAFEGLQTLKKSSGTSSEWDLRGLAPDVCASQGFSMGRPPTPEWSERSFLLDLACSSKGRALIAECIQAFVSTAVTVYLEKTKDVNFYEEMVAGMTKPSHQPAVRELLSSICNGAVETFVRTSHEVLSAGSSFPASDVASQEEGKAASVSDFGKTPAEEFVKNVNFVKGKSPEAAECSASEDAVASRSLAEDSLNKGLEKLKQASQNMILVTGNSRINLLPNWVDGISRTLAVPSNRKLLIEVAGTVTSEAIHSFFEVFLGVIAPYLRGNLKLRCICRKKNNKVVEDCPGSSSASTSSDSGNKSVIENSIGGRIAREIMARSLVVLTVCLAIIMHVLVDVRALKPVPV